MSATLNGVSESKHQPPPPARGGIDFESLPWNLNCPAAHKFVMLKTTSGSWDDATFYDPGSDTGEVVSSIHEYAKTSLDFKPATTSLNYGTTIWEGLKCFRTSKHGGRAAIFRPAKNYARFADGCRAMCLPPPPYELFMRGLQSVVQANADLIPPYTDEGGMKLYIRPIMFGSGQQLGLYPSQEFTLLFYVSPTGSYFKGKSAGGGLNLHLETKFSRAARGGTGNVKCSGNYAVTLRPLMRAKQAGFHDNLYLELDTYKEKGKLGQAVVQELSAANVFLVLKSGKVVTPSLDRGTILPGVTRDSVLKLVIASAETEELRAAMKTSTGVEDVCVSAEERDVCVDDFKQASEAFVTGTAAEIVPIASIATMSKHGEEEPFKVELPHGSTLPGGPVTAKLLELLKSIMAEKTELEMAKRWLPDPFCTAEEFRKAAMENEDI